MRRIWVFIISFAILGGVALLELWSNVQFPMTDLEPGILPSLSVGVIKEYDYFKDDERVGSYVFWVESKGTYDGRDAYFTRSRTSIVHGDGSVELEAVYIFGEELAPYEYRLNASLDNETQFIACFFDGWSVNGTLVIGENIVEENHLELPNGTVLIDYQMLGHWDLLFKSSPLEPGKRYTLNAYMPQALSQRYLELIAEKKLKTVEIGGVEYECNIVDAPALNLVFYIHGGEVIQLVDTEQFIQVSISR